MAATVGVKPPGGGPRAAPKATKDGAKPRRPKAKAADAKPSRTLESWFKPAKKAVADAARLGEGSQVGKEKDEQAPVKAKEKPSGGDAAKRLVQRRIHISDVCRVCDCARSEEASRCELRCVGCEMTVHKKCYGVKDDPPDREWFCRRCQFALDEKDQRDKPEDEDDEEQEEEQESSKPREIPTPDLENTTFPTHDVLPESHQFAALHRDPNFASIFRFLQRFRHLGLRVPADLSLHNLAKALTDPQESRLCEDLHIKLLLTLGASISKNYSWSNNMLRFLDSADFELTTSDKCPVLLGRDKSESMNTDDAVYWSLPVRERIAVLKFLCELQFDRNDKLVERIDEEDADSMRDDPIGSDAKSRAYYVLEDIGTLPNAAVWVCRCVNADGSHWETVCNDFESLESLVQSLSLSTETPDLQLWQTLSGGILKKVARRRKKDERVRNRLARMPRMLSSTDLDASTVVADGGGRSLRSRRQVNYKQIFDDEDEEEDEEEEEQEEEEDEEGEKEENLVKEQGPHRRSRRQAKSSDAESDSVASEVEDEEDDEDEAVGGSDEEETPVRSFRSRKRAPASPPSRRSKRLRHSASPL